MRSSVRVVSVCLSGICPSYGTTRELSITFASLIDGFGFDGGLDEPNVYPFGNRSTANTNRSISIGGSDLEGPVSWCT